MKVKVLQEFTDKHTNKIHAVGEVFECTQDRLTEIESVSKRLVSIVEEKPVEKKQGKAEKKGE